MASQLRPDFKRRSERRNDGAVAAIFPLVHLPLGNPLVVFGCGLETNGGISYWCLVGNGWEWGNGMIITSDYGSFPHSLLSTSKIFIGNKTLVQGRLVGLILGNHIDT